MQNMPMIKIEIEGLKSNVIHLFNDTNKDFSDNIIKTIERTLSAEWVQAEINRAVEDCVIEAIRKVSNSYQLQQCISELIGESIEKIVSKDKP